MIKVLWVLWKYKDGGKAGCCKEEKKDVTEYCSHRESGKAIRRAGSIEPFESGYQRGRSFRAAGTERCIDI